jgi:hypothetical protein
MVAATLMPIRAKEKPRHEGGANCWQSAAVGRYAASNNFVWQADG